MTTRKDPIVKARVFGVLWIALTLAVAVFSMLVSQGGSTAIVVGSVLRAFLYYIPYILFFIYIFLPADKRRKGGLLGIFCIVMALLSIVDIAQSINTILAYMRAQIESYVIVFPFIKIVSSIINIATFVILSIDCFTNFRLSMVSFILVIVKLAKTCLGAIVSFIITMVNFVNMPYSPQSAAVSFISLAENSIVILFVVSLLFVFKSARQNRRAYISPIPMI